jgi:hypothetical protein
MNFKPNENIFRFLFVSPAWFVGATDREDFDLTVSFPSFDRKGKDELTLNGPYSRSKFMLSVEVAPVEKKIGAFHPMYEWVGEEVSALLGGFYGKLVLNLGHYQAGSFLTVPATWDRPCESYSKPPFNSTPRKPDGPKLELPLAGEIIANYIGDNREDKRLSYVLRACEFYRMALENYHERPEMSFTLLASALESLVEMRTYTDAEMYDEKLLSDLAAIKTECVDGEKIVAKLKGRLFQVRRKVVALVDDFLPDAFFSQREAGRAFGVVKDRIELRQRMLGAYDIRSKILHTGDRSGIWFIANDHEGCEIGLGKPVMKDARLVEMLCSSVNLAGLERITSTVLRSAIDRWLQARSRSPAL